MREAPGGLSVFCRPHGTAAMIEVRNIAKQFKQVVAVKAVSFAAQDQRITALLGPNGAGKSTTLRILSTMLTPDSGSAWVGGVDVAENPMQVRRNIGVLPHNSGLYGRLTAIENIRYFGRLQGIDKADLEDRIEALIEQLDMTEFATRRTAGFSQGIEPREAAFERSLRDLPKALLRF